ncbi:lipoprotein [soil metagenome]
MLKLKAMAAIAVIAVVALAGCGSSLNSSSTVDPNAAEVSPPGDIPDNQVFVPYKEDGGSFTVKVPEGWARSSTAAGTEFTDKLNSVTITTTKAPPLSKAEASSTELPSLQKSVTGFSNPKVSTVKRTAGSAVLITYLARGKPDPVTGKSTTNEVERYIFSKGGVRATLSLSGPKGADNVDPWRTISDSLKWNG